MAFKGGSLFTMKNPHQALNGFKGLALKGYLKPLRVEGFP
jgi:hypothetical protein